jgi:hypothetical protein
MGFIPPLNLGNFQPSPATLSQWIYKIWQYLQENPIATQEQLQEYIGNFITTSPETQTMIGEGVEQYLTDNPPAAPVQSVQGKTGAVQLAYNEIVPASNAVPVYKASSTPSANTLTGQYNIGYRLFVNTATQEIFTISPTGALSLVGRGKIDGTTIDLDSDQGDTTIAEALNELNTVAQSKISDIIQIDGENGEPQTFNAGQSKNVSSVTPEVTIPDGYTPFLTVFISTGSSDVLLVNVTSAWFKNTGTSTLTNLTFRRRVWAYSKA